MRCGLFCGLVAKGGEGGQIAVDVNADCFLSLKQSHRIDKYVSQNLLNPLSPKRHFSGFRNDACFESGSIYVRITKFCTYAQNFLRACDKKPGGAAT